MTALENVRVVLMEPEHPGNIGAVARAMANMGLSKLTLVAPLDFPSSVAYARAKGADALLDSAVVVDTLDEAVAECSLVVGCTARARSVQWPDKTPEDAMQALLSGEHSATALLFGRESNGLTNAELDRCHFLTRIPVADSLSSMNLGSAVAVMLYELRRQSLAHEMGERAQDKVNPPDVASGADMRHFYQHLQTIIDKSGFGSSLTEKGLRTMTRLFNRSRMLRPEVKLMRGLLAAIEAMLDSHE